MITLNPQVRVCLAVEHVDFRKGIDGLSCVCRQKLNQDPFSGRMFIFRNRRGTGIKILFYDGQGFWLCVKRLSKGRFRWWPKGEQLEKTSYELLISEIQVLLWNGNPEKSEFGEAWRKIK